MEMHPWLPNLGDLREMLKEIGVKDVEELFSDIPKEIVLKRELNVGYGRPLSEYEIARRLEELSEMNAKLLYPPFLGGGVCPHYVPYAVKMIISRSEFYTAYTPYQPEANQGLLQALFEYQSYMAELLQMEVVNSSLYDWGGALAEAILMVNRINGKKKVIVPTNANPNHLKVAETWVKGKGIELVKVKYNEEGKIDVEDLEKKLTDDIGAVYLQTPNFFGVFETEVEGVVELARKKGALTIMGVNPLALALIKPPGEYNVDIAIGDAQELGIPLSMGGPSLGVFATRWDAKLVRQMPGRIVGLTKDSFGKEGFTLILQTREQFARREKATSNITTNEALMAIAVAVYLSLLGRNGLKELAEEVYLRSHYATKLVESRGIGKRKFLGDFFEEVTLTFPVEYQRIHEKLLKAGLHGGLGIDDYSAVFCFTEVHPKKAIDLLVEKVEEVVKNVEAS
ncbi:MAG: glycine dehydrogenase subunit 1 [Candidatus Aramenus sulfurataquae]|jgi:glycine dehydrogenase subunit 1|uniref:Aminomethyl-transferring glycine dehydrogenase subunit GcvPA n=2 Tax=Candidatus Aramenus sulfurataquae TaxID=1326980 RepID=A0ACC6TNS7_9CREN|nr:MAG: glycine dehydrogenase subunit 1 [Candidatus Aramenus sulfurataquae]MCL7344009.1 aminomethyl-transferring glycine dehydrogenase subunit GcvPA [Candidatus Aramenus sulfurataquae]